MRVWVAAIFVFISGSLFGQTLSDLKAQFETSNGKEKAQIANSLSESLMAQKQYDEAIEYAEEAIELSESVGSKSEELRGHVNAGNALKKTKDFKKTIDHFEDAAKIAESEGMTELVAYSYESIAFAYNGLKKYDESTKFYEKALLAHRHSPKEHAAIFSKQAFNFYASGELKRAISSYEEADKLYQKHSSPKDHARTLLNLGGVYANYGNYEKGLATLERAESIAKSNNLSSLGAIQSAINDVKKNQDSKSNAVTAFDEDQIKETEDYIKTIESNNVKSLEEIEQLSVENQVKELKLLNQQNELILKEQEAETQRQELEKFELEKAKKEAELKQTEAEQARTQAWLIGASGAFLLLLLLVAVVVINNRKLKEKNEQIASQNHELDKKNQSITESINYARKIQNALLVSNVALVDRFSEHFIFNKPRDIVSGDFSWCHNNGNDCVVVVADCTGHGVPGALMSVLAISTLEKIVKQEGVRSPAKILKRFNNDLHELFGSHKTDDSVKDGMDVVVLNIDNNNEMVFAGSRNSMVKVSNNELEELKGNTVHLGYYKDHEEFNTTKVQLNKNDALYLYSDGFYDQKGGKEGKKFYPKRFREMLLDHSSRSMESQNQEFEKIFSSWKRNYEQIDDIIILGIRI